MLFNLHHSRGLNNMLLKVVLALSGLLLALWALPALLTVATVNPASIGTMIGAPQFTSEFWQFASSEDESSATQSPLPATSLVQQTNFIIPHAEDASDGVSADPKNLPGAITVENLGPTAEAPMADCPSGGCERKDEVKLVIIEQPCPKEKEKTELVKDHPDSVKPFTPDEDPGVSVHVYDLPPHMDRDLVAKHPICSEWQWAAEVKLPVLFREREKAMRTNPSAADFYLVPFPSKCYFNEEAGKNRGMMDRVFIKIVEYIKNVSPWWDRTDGRDHIFIFPSGIGASMFPSWARYIPNSVFLLAEGDRTKDYINTWKDIIVPAVPSFRNETRVTTFAPLSQRDIFLHFRGKFHMVIADFKGHTIKAPSPLRTFLGRELKNEPGVVFNNERIHVGYAEEVARAIFCICPRGSTPWTRRVFDSIFAGCIPVIVSDHVELPFENFLDYEEFTVKISEADAMKPRRLISMLRSIPKRRQQKMLGRLKEVKPIFVYDGGYAFNAILWELHRRKRTFKHSNTRTWPPL